MQKILIFGAFVLLLCMACGKERRADKDRELIEDYLATNNLTAEVTEEGVYYIIDNPGTGTAHPTLDSRVTVDYKGYLLDGSEFDSGTATFSLTGVIQGWQIGIPKYKKGGTGTLLIPSGLAYGKDSPSPDIPRHSVLVFDINLIDF